MRHIGLCARHLPLSYMYDRNGDDEKEILGEISRRLPPYSFLSFAFKTGTFRNSECVIISTDYTSEFVK